MITGLVSAGHVHLTKVARATHRGEANIHGALKRLSGHLKSEHWNTAPLAAELLRRSAAMVTERVSGTSVRTTGAGAWKT